MLYRKHRPQTWEDITAQSHVTKTIQQEIISNTCAHAFLFCGPRGVGKTTTARLLAKSLNCTNRSDSAEPCNECDNCKQITATQAVDVIEIDAASHTGVDNVRENIIENARFTPTQSKFKVFVIDEVHMLSTSAFNALLKTIEEPPAHAIFIMATTELHKIPATILSRCQRFDFKHIGTSDIKNRLQSITKKEGLTIDEEVLEHVAWRAQGSMRDGESLLGQIIAVAQNNTVTTKLSETVLPARNIAHLISFIQNALTGHAQQSLEQLHTAMETGAHITHTMDDCIDIARTLLLIKTAQSFGDSFFNAADREKLTAIAEQTSTEQLLFALESFINRRTQIGLTPVIHLPLELAAIDIALQAGLQTNPPVVIPAQAGIQSNSEEAPEPQQPVISNDSEKSPPIQQTESEPTPEPTPKTETQQPTQKSQSTQTPPPVIPAKAGIPSEPANKSTEQSPTLSLADINKKWQDFITHLGTINHSLPFILKTCTPSALNDTELTLSLPYEFHQKKLQEPAIKHSIETALNTIFQTQLTIKAIISSDKQTDSEKVVAKALETFGGQVVSE